MSTIRSSLLLLVATVMLAACSSQPTRDADDDAAARAAAERAAAEARAEEQRRAEAEALAAQERLRADPLNDPNSMLAQRVIYFDFDRYEVKPEFMSVVQAHAQYLAQNPNVRVTLEGHTDERGSREYNIGLGNRRAQAVRRLLMFHGVAESQISTVSYGEEQPAAMGQNEQAWARNRRVEIDYSAR